MTYQELQEHILETQRTLDVYTEKLLRLEEDIHKKDQALHTFLTLMKNEKKDVDALETLSFTTFFHKIRGTYEAQRTKEEDDYYAAKLLYEEKKEVLRQMRQHKDKQSLLHKEAKETLKELLRKRREEYVEGQELEEELVKKKSALYYTKKELSEAREALLAVIETGEEAKRYLNSAQGMATIDTFLRGGMITDLIKYGELEKSTQYLALLETLVTRLQGELQDVEEAFSSTLETIEPPEQFIDIFFDNIFTDWGVREKITKNLTLLSSFLEELKSLQKNLEIRMEKVDQALQALYRL